MGLLVCDLCGADGKYKCPRCDTRSCSVACVQQHKQVSGCDGIRKKVKYIPVNKFTDLDLVQDFRILESASATVDKCRRDKLKKCTNQNVDGFMAPRIPMRKRKLEQAAARRGVQVKFLPSHFARSKDNKSTFNSKSKELSWDVDLYLPHADKTIKLNSVPDTTKLWKLVAPLFEPDISEDQDVGFQKSQFMNLTQEDFDTYRSFGYGGVLVYLRTETRRRKRNGENMSGETDDLPKEQRYTELDMKRSLRHNLRGHALVEHPCLEVVSKWEACNYRNQMIMDFYEEQQREETRVENENIRKEEEGDEIMEKQEEENPDTEAEAYNKYYNFYFNYYSNKYSATDKHQTTEDKNRLPNVFGQFEAENFDRVVPENIQQSDVTYHEISAKKQEDVFSAKPNKAQKLQQLNEKNLENARKIGDEIRREAFKDDIQLPKKEEKGAGGGGFGLLGGLVEYSDSDSE
eukprot:TRINITY_DN1710_c0_g1_i7.p1 TRINITY_DN1710_c0_g1~~TRINITY_DN1710_c0_g1_i7.p1  ORF type:complete len:461 (+),score=104.80 TRINITY_DN1710_c0_g1_i7:46-1428(+)